MKAPGAAAMPSSTVSRQVIWPALIQPVMSARKPGRSPKWSETMKPSIRRRLPTTLMMLDGPGEAAMSLYCEIMPQTANRAKGRAALIAASRWVPPTLSK